MYYNKQSNHISHFKSDVSLLLGKLSRFCLPVEQKRINFCFAGKVAVCLVLFISTSTVLQSSNARQTDSIPTQQVAKAKTEEAATVPFKSRISLRTNAIDWLLIAPNMAIEFDLSGAANNKLTLGVGIKGNWDTYQNYKPSIVYNFFDARLELRKYWRTEKRQAASTTTGLREWLKEDVFSRKRANPRYWRAYYAGGYINGSKYTLKLGRKGIQGTAYGMGLTAGFGIPLYGYNNKFVDLELGGSIGLMMAEYEVFTHDRSSNCYSVLPEEKRGTHLVPYPIINDLRVAFVFRFSSIKNKYKQ